MRIGIVAPPWFAVPPDGYGGIERVVSYLADGLVELGHDVTLFASGGSRTKARLVTTFDTPPSTLLGEPLVEAEHLAMAYCHWEEFDIIHDHTRLGLVTAAALPIPVVHTVHGPVRPEFELLFRRVADRVHMVCISGSQASEMPPEACTTVIWNALDLNDYPFEAEHGEYLLFVGRINPDKGVLPAIEMARRSGRKLIMCAKINEPDEHEYFETVVRHELAAADVDFRREVSPAELGELYAGAYATLFPIQWPEPFGLVMIESMAAGTPVIAFRNGSVPEVVQDGVTGFVCENVEEAVAAIEQVGSLDRLACRQRVRELFSAPVAVAKHEALYKSLLLSPSEGLPPSDSGPETLGEPLAR